MFGEPKQVYPPGILILCGVFASPDSLGRDIELSYACAKEGITRYVEVVTEPDYACRVKYTKPSVTTFPWNARYDANYCRPKAIDLVEKLNASGWECDSAEDVSSIPPAEDVSSIPPAEEVSSIPSAEDVSSIPPAEDVSSIPPAEDVSSIPPAEDVSSIPPAEVVRSILLAQIENYGRYIESYQVVGKTCYFYPTEAQFGNLCGDAQEEAVIVYTCEVDAGGWDQHLAVFHEIETEPFVTEVGRSGLRQVSSYHIDDAQLMMESEKIDPVEDSTAALYPVEKSVMQCRYSGSEWELFEKQ